MSLRSLLSAGPQSGLARFHSCSVSRRLCLARFYSSQKKGPVDVEALLREPTWSVQSLFASEVSSTSHSSPSTASTSPTITKEQLHHLLELSALPLPKSEEEEERMIIDLQAQLRFVQAIQAVDTEGVEPLQAIRDETAAGRKKNTITVESLKEEFAKEEAVGKRGQIRRKKMPQDETVAEEQWDPLPHARRMQGRYIVVDTKRD